MSAFCVLKKGSHMVRKKELSPELIAEARRLFEQTLTLVKDIVAIVGLTRPNFYYRVRDWGWHQRRRAARTARSNSSTL
jgi:hypothetical protein